MTGDRARDRPTGSARPLSVNQIEQAQRATLVSKALHTAYPVEPVQSFNPELAALLAAIYRQDDRG